MKILLITDDVELQSRFGNIVSNFPDIEADLALTTGEGLSRIKYGAPDIVILDSESVRMDAQTFFNHLTDAKINIPAFCIGNYQKINYPLFKGTIGRTFGLHEFRNTVLKKGMRSRKKILLVEDDRIFSDVVFNLLSPLYDFHLAYDGVTALKLIKSLRPDLIILDINLPDINGFRLCRSIKEDIELNAKVLMLTVRGTDRDLRLGEGAGADGYIQKPISNDRFLAEVAKLLSED